MKNVNLTIDEIQVASMVGIQRQLEDIAQNKNPTFNEKKELAWQRHIEGALSECALAKYLNVYWNKQKWDLPDVGGVDVRCTHYHTGRLIIQNKDIDDRKYYLLTGLNGSYIIRGYIFARDGKQEKFLANPTGLEGRGGYFVPQEFLLEA